MKAFANSSSTENPRPYKGRAVLASSNSHSVGRLLHSLLLWPARVLEYGQMCQIIKLEKCSYFYFFIFYDPLELIKLQCYPYLPSIYQHAGGHCPGTLDHDQNYASNCKFLLNYLTLTMTKVSIYFLLNHYFHQSIYRVNFLKII